MASSAADVVQELAPEGGESAEQNIFLSEEDVLEMEEVGEGDEEMEGVESDGEGDDQEGGEGEEQDGALRLLDNGLDDSLTSYVGHEAAVFSVALHPIFPTLAVSGGGDDLGHLWRTDTAELVMKLEGHTDSVTSVAFSFDGEMVATGGMDGRCRVWRHVRGSQGWYEWEFLMSLEGPDEVNVSANCFGKLFLVLVAYIAFGWLSYRR